MTTANSVCVLLPAYNEELTIENCIRAVRIACPAATILVVDNASKDQTAELARRTGAQVITETRPGKGYAVATGVEWALQRDFAWIALHDADNEYSANDLASLIAESQTLAANETTAMVMGVGLREVSLGKVLWRSLLANFVARLALRLALHKAPPPDILTGSRVFNQECARKLVAGPAAAALRGFELETALTRRALKEGVKVAYAPVRYTPRAAHQKKITAWDMLPILKAAWHA